MCSFLFLVFFPSGIQLKDLIALNTALPDTLNGGRLINVQKMIRLSDIMSKLIGAQTTPPPVLPNSELINMLRVIERTFPCWRAN